MVRTQTIDRSHSDLNMFSFATAFGAWRCYIELWLNIWPFCWTQPSNSWGVNCRKFHSFHTEDWIGRIKMCCAVTHQQGLEHIALMRWFTGSLYCIIYIFVSYLGPDHGMLSWQLPHSMHYPRHPRLTNKSQAAEFDSWDSQRWLPEKITRAGVADELGGTNSRGNHQNHIQFLGFWHQEPAINQVSQKNIKSWFLPFPNFVSQWTWLWTSRGSGPTGQVPSQTGKGILRVYI